MSTLGTGRIPCSVIVPVYEQWGQVPELLRALADQSMDRSAFEVILVDNGSRQVPSFDDIGLSVRLCRCDTPGSYAARNHGLQHARGEVMAFTDADCLPHRQWLEAGLASLRERGGEAIVAGRVRVTPVSPSGRETAAEQYDLALGFPQARYVSRGYGVTANLFMPAMLFDSLGPFEEGRFSGGDADFCRRAGRNGVPVVYSEAAVVDHPARRDMAELVRKIRRVKGGQLRHGPWRRRVLYVIRSFMPPARALWRIVRLPGLRWGQRSRVCGVQLRLWWVECREVVRLSLGADAERR